MAHNKYNPTPSEIRQRSAEIRRGWSKRVAGSRGEYRLRPEVDVVNVRELKQAIRDARQMP